MRITYSRQHVPGRGEAGGARCDFSGLCPDTGAGREHPASPGAPDPRAARETARKQTWGAGGRVAELRAAVPRGLALARRQSHVAGQRGLLARTRAGRPGPWDQGVREGGLGAELLQTAGHRAAGTSVRKEAPHRTRRPSRAATPSPGPSDGAPPNRAHGFTQQTACIATFEFIMFYRMKTAPSSPGGDALVIPP